MPHMHATPFPIDGIKQLTQAPLETVRGLQARALAVMTFGSVSRLGEIIGRGWQDISIEGSRVSVTIPTSKTDKEQRGVTKVIDYPSLASALRALDVIRGGGRQNPVFREPQAPHAMPWTDGRTTRRQATKDQVIRDVHSILVARGMRISISGHCGLNKIRV